MNTEHGETLSRERGDGVHRWRQTANWRFRAYTLYRDASGKQCSIATHTSDPAKAELHRLVVEARQRGERGQPEPDEGLAPAETLEPDKAVERFLAYLLSLRRKPASIEYYRWKLAPPREGVVRHPHGALEPEAPPGLPRLPP